MTMKLHLNHYLYTFLINNWKTFYASLIELHI